MSSSGSTGGAHRPRAVYTDATLSTQAPPRSVMPETGSIRGCALATVRPANTGTAHRHKDNQAPPQPVVHRAALALRARIKSLMSAKCKSRMLGLG